MTRDGGVMLLGTVNRKPGLMDAAARCIADPRSPLLIKHGLRDMLRQRVYGLTRSSPEISSGNQWSQFGVRVGEGVPS